MHNKKAGKLQTGSTFPKQYWLAVNGKPTTGSTEKKDDRFIVNQFLKQKPLTNLPSPALMNTLT